MIDLKYFTINLDYKIRHDLVSNPIFLVSTNGSFVDPLDALLLALVVALCLFLVDH